MPSIFIYILGAVLILYIVKADQDGNIDGVSGTEKNGSEYMPTTTLAATPAHTPSATQNSPNLVQADYHDSNFTKNITIGRDGNQSQDQNKDIRFYNVTTVAVETSQSEEVDLHGYVILFLILLVIICLVVVLYVLRKKSRKYSFDLHLGHDHDTPLTCMEQAGTFEPNEKAGGFEYVIEGGGDDHQAMSPVANGSAGETAQIGEVGSAGETGEAGSTGENGEKQGDGDGDSFNNFCGCAITLTPPVKRVGFSLDMDLSDRQSDKSDNGEQNGNNNNVAVGMTPDPLGLTFDPVGPGDVFTEINLDI